MALAGRCACGVRTDLAAKDPDDHLSCNGLRRCRGCEEVKVDSEFFHYGPSRGGKPYARCKACWADFKRKEYQRKPKVRERKKAEARRFYYENKLKTLDRKARYYRAHAEAERERSRVWRAKHRDRINANRRAFQAKFGAMVYLRRKARERKAA